MTEFLSLLLVFAVSLCFILLLVCIFVLLCNGV